MLVPPVLNNPGKGSKQILNRKLVSLVCVWGVYGYECAHDILDSTTHLPHIRNESPFCHNQSVKQVTTVIFINFPSAISSERFVYICKSTQSSALDGDSYVKFMEKSIKCCMCWMWFFSAIALFGSSSGEFLTLISNNIKLPSIFHL